MGAPGRAPQRPADVCRPLGELRRRRARWLERGGNPNFSDADFASERCRLLCVAAMQATHANSAAADRRLCVAVNCIAVYSCRLRR